MKNTLTAGAALLLTTSLAHAVGLDRSGQAIGIIFEEGSYAELSFGYVVPDVSGADLAGPAAGVDFGNVGLDYGQLGLGYKRDINEQTSFALILDEPYGADIEYDSTASFLLGGTSAELNSVALTGLVRHKIDSNFSVHGGLRAQSFDANITLGGAAFAGAGIDGDYELAQSTGLGYLVGAAYERPDIALRVALTYFSEVTHEVDITDPTGDSQIDVKTPQAVNIDFQTGIAADTLLFGNIRWAEYSVVQVLAPNLGGGSLTDIDDAASYSVGIGRRFSDVFSGSVSVGFEPEGEDPLVSPLGPTNGNYSVGVAGQYAVDENITISGGVRYIVPGDATAAPGGTAAADFADNSAIGVGFKVGYSF